MAIISIKDKYDANKVYVVKATDLAPLVSADGLTSYGVTVDALLKIERDRAEAVEAQLLLTTGGNVTGKYNFGDPGNEDGFIKVNGVDTDAQVKINTFDDVYTSEFIIHRHSTSDPGNIIFSRSKSTDAAHGNVVDGDVTGEVVYSGWHTSSYWKTAMVNSAVDGTPASGDMPGRLNFHTTPAGSAVPALAFSLRSNKKAEFAGDVEITGDLTGTINAAGRVSALYNDTVSSSLYCYNSNTANFAVSGQFVASAASLGSYAVQASGAGSNSRVIYSSATGANSVAVQGYNSNASGVGVKGDAGVNAGALGGRFSNTITTSDHLEVAAETNFLVGYKTAVEQFRITNAGAGLFIGGVDKLTTATGAVSVAAAAAPAAGQVLTAVTATTATWQAGTSAIDWGEFQGGTAPTVAPSAPGTGAMALGEGAAASTGTSATGGIAIGTNSSATEGNSETNGIAIGTGSTANRAGNVALGLNAGPYSGTSNGSSIAIGPEAKVFGSFDLCIGRSAQSRAGSENIVLGNSSYVTTGGTSSVIVGNVCYSNKGHQLILGDHLNITSPTATDVAYSTKIGYDGEATNRNFIHLHSKGKLALEGAEAQFVLPNYTTVGLPATTVQGGTVYDSTTKQLKYYNNTSFAALVTTTMSVTLNANNQDIDNAKTVTFNSEIANTGTTQTINWTSGQKQKTTITAATGVTFTAPAGPCNLTLKIVNGGTGVITWPASVTWPGGTEPTWTTTGTDIASFYYDGTNYHGMAGLAFA